MKILVRIIAWFSGILGLLVFAGGFFRLDFPLTALGLILIGLGFYTNERLNGCG